MWRGNSTGRRKPRAHKSRRTRTQKMPADRRRPPTDNRKSRYIKELPHPRFTVSPTFPPIREITQKCDGEMKEDTDRGSNEGTTYRKEGTKED